MSRQVSTNTKLLQLHGMLGTKKLTPGQAGFVSNLYVWSQQGKDVTFLSDKQLEFLNGLWEKHFA